MRNENKVVMGIYGTRGELEDAVDELRSCGFRNADISALLPSPETTKDFAHSNATKLPEGAATGGMAGAIIGGTLGWLAGAGVMAIPGLGPFIAAGPIVATLAGMGVGTTLGGVAGALIGWGMPEYEAKRYEGYVRSGGHLLSVHCDNEDWVRLAREVLEETGAHEVSSSQEAASRASGAEERGPRAAR